MKAIYPHSFIECYRKDTMNAPHSASEEQKQ